MKIFVLKKRSIMFYAVLLVAAFTVVFTRWDNATFVFNNNSQLNSLPIYCVDKGDEKVCAISFDAAWAAS